MKLLTVKMHERVGDESDFVEIDLIDDVNYIDLWERTRNSNRVLAFHTSHGSYLAITTLADIAAVCEKYGFELAGKSACINSSRVDSVKAKDHNGSTIIFIDGTHVDVSKQI
jgi:DNA-binding LytR/AlgR family response regulator